MKTATLHVHHKNHLALGVIEVGGHSDDSLLHLVVQELGGISRQLAQHLQARTFHMLKSCEHRPIADEV